jgi:hypothetical protein
MERPGGSAVVLWRGWPPELLLASSQADQQEAGLVGQDARQGRKHRQRTEEPPVTSSRANERSGGRNHGDNDEERESHSGQAHLTGARLRGIGRQVEEERRRHQDDGEQ